MAAAKKAKLDEEASPSSASKNEEGDKKKAKRLVKRLTRKVSHTFEKHWSLIPKNSQTTVSLCYFKYFNKNIIAGRIDSK